MKIENYMVYIMLVMIWKPTSGAYILMPCHTLSWRPFKIAVCLPFYKEIEGKKAINLNCKNCRNVMSGVSYKYSFA